MPPTVPGIPGFELPPRPRLPSNPDATAQALHYSISVAEMSLRLVDAQRHQIDELAHAVEEMPKQTRKQIRRALVLSGGAAVILAAAMTTWGTVRAAQISTAAQQQAKATTEHTLERDDELVARIAKETSEQTLRQLERSSAKQIDQRFAALEAEIERDKNRRQPSKN